MEVWQAVCIRTHFYFGTTVAYFLQSLTSLSVGVESTWMKRGGPSNSETNQRFSY